MKYGDSADVPIEAGSYLVTVDISAKGYVKEPLTLGYYTILSTEQSSMKVLSFVTNGGDPIEPSIEMAGESITVPTELTRAGYTFAGWYEDVTLRNKVEPFPTTMPDTNKTYYAKWTRDSYNITYNLDGGTDPGNPTTYHVETETFTLIVPTKPGYKFTGWTGSNGETAQKEVSIAKGSIGDREYTANWEMITYTITYPNTYDRVDGNPASYTATETATTAIPLTNPAEREGYTFAGWTMVVDGTAYILPATGAEIPQGTLGHITLTGIWLAKNQTLTLDANGGQFADGNTTATITAEYGSSINLTQPTRSGYTFAGWYTDESCTSPFTGGTMPLAMTIYAKWTAIPSGGGVTTYAVITPGSVTGGSVSASPSRAGYGSTVTITVTPDEGYKLDELTVTDASGNEIAVRSMGGNRFVFTMPRSRVIVEATFAELGGSAIFTDVPAGEYYYDAVYWAVENGVTNGTSATTFSPNAACTRAQMVTFLWRAAGSPEPESGENPFTDVSGSAYYYEAVLWAVENGITNGTSATTFSPDATVTRGQTVTFLWRYDGTPAAGGVSFADVPADAYYSAAVAWAVENGITNGTGANTFSPDAACTRAQIVTFLYRQLG